MFIDKNGKLFGRINIIDLGVLLVMAFVVLAVLYKAGVLTGGKKTAAPEMKYYILKVKCPNIEEESIGNLVIGDTIRYDKFPDTKVKIKDYVVKNAEAKQIVMNQDGQMAVRENPSLKDVYIDLLVPSPANDPFVRIGTNIYNVGNSITIKTYRVFFTGKIIKITEGD